MTHHGKSPLSMQTIQAWYYSDSDSGIYYRNIQRIGSGWLEQTHTRDSLFKKYGILTTHALNKRVNFFKLVGGATYAVHTYYRGHAGGTILLGNESITSISTK